MGQPRDQFTAQVTADEMFAGEDAGVNPGSLGYRL